MLPQLDQPMQNQRASSFTCGQLRHTLNAEVHDTRHRKPARDQAVAQPQVPVSACAGLDSLERPCRLHATKASQPPSDSASDDSRTRL